MPARQECALLLTRISRASRFVQEVIVIQHAEQNFSGDRFRRQRGRLVLAYAAAFALWQVGELLRPVADRFAEVVFALSLTGAVGCTLILFWGLWLGRA